MISSKAIEVLLTFSPDELKEFGQFIRSPYFNSNKNLIKLFDAVKGSLGKDVTEEFLYEKIFPDKNYNYGIFKNLLSEMYVKVCDFLAISRVRMMKGDRNTYLIKELVDRKLVKHADKWISITKDFFKEKNMSIEDLHTDFLMEEYSSFSNYARDQRWLQNLSRKEDALLMSKKFAVYFLARFISQYLFITHPIFKLKREINLRPMQDIIDDTYKFLTENLEEKAPVVEILYHIVKMNSEPENSKWYFKLKEVFFENKEYVSSQVARNGYIYLSNYCQDRFEEGDDKFLYEQFNIERDYFRSDLPMRSIGGINPDTFEKIVENALAVGEIDYAEDFIEKYNKALPETARNTSFHFSKAYLEFYKRNYEEAISLLAKMDGGFVLTLLTAKELQLMIYYELGEWNRFYTQAQSLKAFIANHNKVHPERKKARLGFVKNITALGKIKENSGVKKSGLDVKLNELLRNFKKEPSVSRVWLSAKANELKSKLKN